MLLGYDLDPRDEGGTLADYLTARDELAAEAGVPLASEIGAARRCSPTSPS